MDTELQQVKDVNSQKVSASFASPGFDGKAPDSIVFFPAGKHEISASKNGKPAKVSVEITAEIADLLDAQLKDALKGAENGTASRPFVDFEHTGGRAAALPKAFRWEASLGVMVDLEWTPAGRAAVEGKEFSYFSPEWLMDGSKITGLSQPGPIGGLVNTPAFQTIGKIAAALTTKPTMDAILQLLKDLGMIAKDATEITPEVIALLKEKLTPKPEIEVEMEAVKAAHVKDSADLITARASIASLTKQIETHAAELAKVKASVNDEVARVVHAAGLKTPVNAGKIAASAEQNEVTRAAFEKMSPSEQLAHVKAGKKIL